MPQKSWVRTPKFALFRINFEEFDPNFAQFRISKSFANGVVLVANSVACTQSSFVGMIRAHHADFSALVALFGKNL